MACSEMVTTSLQELENSPVAAQASLPQSSRIYRGITNATGTGCHTSSVLQLLFHCFPRLREELLNLANISAHCCDVHSSRADSDDVLHDDDKKRFIETDKKEFVYHLSWFFYLLAYAEDIIKTAQQDAPLSAASCAVGPKSPKRKKSRSRRENIDGKKAAAIDAFVAKSRNGKTNMLEWRNLVDLMKHDNRKKYDKALGLVLNRNSSSAVDGVDMVASNKVEPLNSPLNEFTSGELPKPSSKSVKGEKSAIEELICALERVDMVDNKTVEESAEQTVEQPPVEESVAREFLQQDNVDILEKAVEPPEQTMEHHSFVKSATREQLQQPLSKTSKKEKFAITESIGPVLETAEAVPSTLPKPKSMPGKSLHKELQKKTFMKSLFKKIRGNHQDNEGQCRGNLGGGRKLGACELSWPTLEGVGDAIDPANFYEHLTSYTADAMEARNHVNTNNAGDAAIVFRCLIAALEFSIDRELKRLGEIISLFEIENWNMNEETKEGDETQPTSVQRNAYRLRSSLAGVKAAMDYEWSGNLLSRIVGISQTATVSCDNTITTTTITRTKKNGSIKRPIPIPWQLPVLEQTNNVQTGENIVATVSVDEFAQNLPQKNYFESLSTSLYSVTICPNPIRGYNWHGLIKKGDVVEEISITKMDDQGNILVEKEDEVIDYSEDADAAKSEEKEGDEKEQGGGEIRSPMSPARTVDSDDISVTSVSSRTIGTQTDLDEDVEIRTISVRSRTEEAETDGKARADASVDTDVETFAVNTSETSSTGEASRQPNKNLFAVEKDSCYAAAVAALSTAPKGRRSSRRRKLNKIAKLPKSDKNDKDAYYAAAVAALASSQNSSPRDFVNGVEVTFPNSDSINSDEEMSVDIEEESSFDSKVPSVDDASSETHSSAIETPSDIDDISLGSWTDSEADNEEKKNEEEVLIRKISECDDYAQKTAVHDSLETSHRAEEKAATSSVVPTEVEHSVCSNSYSAISDSNCDSASSSDDSSTSSSSNSTSSTRSDSTSSTDSSSNSSNSSSSSSSSSSERDIADAGVTESEDEIRSAYSNSTKKKEWITRKETRFCQPLPRSLIFHLKRFAFTPSGHGEKLPGSLNIPAELNLRACCLEEGPNDCYCFQLAGAIVHVDPILDEDEQDQLEHGTMSEGHYVTFVSKPAENNQDEKTWIELDDEFVRVVDSRKCGDEDEKCTESSTDIALNILSGCDVSNNKKTCGASTSSKRVVTGEERRYATLLVYSRKS